MSAYDQVLAGAMQLTEVERSHLIEALLDSLPEDFEYESPPLSAEWLAEIERRSAALDRRETKTVPMESVMGELKQRFAT